jgi:hypothetical protein
LPFFTPVCEIFCFATITICESGHHLATIADEKGKGMAKKPHLRRQSFALIALNPDWLR